MSENEVRSVRIYTHYNGTKDKTMVVAASFDYKTSKSYSFIVEGEVTERIIKDLDSVYTNKAIRLGGFYFNNLYVNMRKKGSDIDINGLKYELIYE